MSTNISSKVLCSWCDLRKHGRINNKGIPSTTFLPDVWMLQKTWLTYYIHLHRHLTENLIRFMVIKGIWCQSKHITWCISNQLGITTKIQACTAAINTFTAIKVCETSDKYVYIVQVCVQSMFRGQAAGNLACAREINLSCITANRQDLRFLSFNWDESQLLPLPSP